jgi:hypothetical protein
MFAHRFYRRELPCVLRWFNIHLIRRSKNSQQGKYFCHGVDCKSVPFLREPILTSFRQMAISTTDLGKEEVFFGWIL